MQLLHYQLHHHPHPQFIAHVLNAIRVCFPGELNIHFNPANLNFCYELQYNEASASGEHATF